MKTQELITTAITMVAGDKGLLAMDESTPTCNKRFAALGIPQTEAARRAYRELIVTTPGLGESISGAILFDETIRQRKKTALLFVKVLTDAGIIPGIKVDTGAKDLAGHPGEKITEGLDGLRDRLAEYSRMGARFAKWRAVIAVGDGIPSRGCIEANAHALARYAALCQEAGLVPVVEPEVLMDGGHTPGAVPRSDGGGPANGVQPTLHATGDAGRNDPEAQHGASRIGLPHRRCVRSDHRRTAVSGEIDPPQARRCGRVADATVRCLLRPSPPPFRGLRSCRAANSLNWPRPG